MKAKIMTFLRKNHGFPISYKTMINHKLLIMSYLKIHRKMSIFPTKYLLV